jgi:hypothetical protein
LAFVSHDRIFGKAQGQGIRITQILGGEIHSDGFWKIRHHTEI